MLNFWHIFTGMPNQKKDGKGAPKKSKAKGKTDPKLKTDLTFEQLIELSVKTKPIKKGKK